jgi:hypothetical protein
MARDVRDISEVSGSVRREPICRRHECSFLPARSLWGREPSASTLRHALRGCEETLVLERSFPEGYAAEEWLRRLPPLRVQQRGCRWATRPRPDTRGQKTRMPRDPKGSSGIALRLLRRVNVPRAPSLELYVLPNGGGQLLSPHLIPNSHTCANHSAWS